MPPPTSPSSQQGIHPIEGEDSGVSVRSNIPDASRPNTDWRLRESTDTPAQESEASEALDDEPTQLEHTQLSSDLNVNSISEPLPSTEQSPQIQPPHPLVGTTLGGRYYVEALIGEGGMGIVCRARHTIIDKKVAIKVLRADLARDGEMVERFLQEARAASSVGNPHIVDISDFGHLPDGSTYFVMEHLEGESLSHWLDSRRLRIDEIIEITCQIADGLSAAHQRNIVHRDLKPDNIILAKWARSDRFVKILDFGIAKVSSGATSKLTKAGSVFGTPHYMSPEQAAGNPVDHRADIYALGVMLYEMVTGQVPFHADNFMAILSQHMYKDPVPVRQVPSGAHCPEELESVILRCMAKDPAKRFASMGELLAALQPFRPQTTTILQQSPNFTHTVELSLARPIGNTTGSSHPSNRTHRIFYGAAAFIAMTGSLLLVWAIRSRASATASPSIQVSTATTTSQTEQITQTAVVAENSIVVAANIDSAKAYIDGSEQALDLPTTIRVRSGERVHLTVRADGYDTASITLDGSEPRKLVNLTKRSVHPNKSTTTATPTAKPHTTTTVTPTPRPTSDVVDPWGVKAP